MPITVSVILQFGFLIFLANYLAFCSAVGRHSPKSRDDRTHRNHQRNARQHNDEQHHQKNVKSHGEKQQRGNDKAHGAAVSHHEKMHGNDNKHGKGKHGANELGQSVKTKRHIENSTNVNEANKQRANEEHKEVSLQSCDQLGRHFFSQCFEISSKTGQCHSNELPMRIKDCLHLKKFINTNLHTLVEAPNGGVETHTHNPATAAAVHANGEHVGAFVTAKNVMCCTVSTENALHHAIQMINNRLMVAHELALYRFAHQIPVDDPEREATVLKHVGNQANAAGIDAEFAVNFLLAQMEANKMIQRGYIDRWNSDHSFESKYVPDFEKEIQPKFSYATNALILSLIPLVDAGHQMHNDQNCVEHVEDVLESMEHLRASELEPNGKEAMEKAVKAICEKISTHEGQSNAEDYSKSKKRKHSDKHKMEEEKHGEEKESRPTKRTRKANAEESKSPAGENRRNHRRENDVHSQTTKEQTKKESPRKRENAKNDEHKKSAQNRNVRKGKKQSEESWEDDIEKVTKKSPRKIEEVSDTSIMITRGEKSRGTNGKDKMSPENKKIEKKSDAKVKSPRKSPRRIEVSDRSVLIKMEDLISDEKEHLTSSERNETDAYSKRQVKKSPFKNKVTTENERQNKSKSPAEEQKRNAVAAIDKSFDVRFDSEEENPRKALSTETIRNPSLISRDASIPMSSRNLSADQHETERKDSLVVHRNRRIKDNERAKSTESDENLQNIGLSRDDKSMADEANDQSKVGSWSMEKTENRRNGRAQQNEESRQNSNISLHSPSRLLTGISTEHGEEQRQQSEEEAMESTRKSRFAMPNASGEGHQSKNSNEKEEKDHYENIREGIDEKNYEHLKSEEFHHIELEPDAESIVIHTPGGEKPVKIKLSRKPVKGNEIIAKEENENGKNSEKELQQQNREQSNELHFKDEAEEEGKASKNKFKLKKTISSISAEEKNESHQNDEMMDEKMEKQSEEATEKATKKKFSMKKVVGSVESIRNNDMLTNGADIENETEKQSGESLRISPKNKFKIKKAVSSASAAEEENNTQIDEAKMGEQSGESTNKSQKNRFKMKRVGSEVNNMAEGQSEEHLQSPPIDKSNEYVGAPEKISAEFSGKSAGVNEAITDHSASFENYGGQTENDKK
ncbi:hypothetical protein niasHT_032351 [Heterodera trifolii]|uniref:chorismate mutase n=1 Tax=Heterodera trifolii TaxID=157864 RepID=A0ABD2HVC7_9BILA